MCTCIVTIRAVLWYVVSLAGTLMILVALFANKWLEGQISTSNLGSAENILDTVAGIGQTVVDGDVGNALSRDVGLFLRCKVPVGPKFFEGECVPDWDSVETLFTDLDDTKYPHAWRGAVICFVLGLGLLVISDLFALLTVCCRSCICCSVFTVCGSIQTFAWILFSLGLVAYPAGWGSQVVNETYCAGDSAPFILGSKCSIGFAFWLAVAGTICTFIASTLAVWAYQSTKRCKERQDDGERCICGP